MEISAFSLAREMYFRELDPDGTLPQEKLQAELRKREKQIASALAEVGYEDWENASLEKWGEVIKLKY